MGKKWIILLLIFCIIGGGAYLFRSDLMNLLSKGKNKAVEMALEKVSAKYNIPPKAQNDIKDIAKKVDPKILLELLTDPNAFMQGKSEKAMEFMKSPEGKKLTGYLNKYIKK